ncbi:MAG: hypothetical protein P1P86_15335 [Bacteroidales bacterium]|nr:hypothetical protein [Bacteroidales bacterium]
MRASLFYWKEYFTHVKDLINNKRKMSDGGFTICMLGTMHAKGKTKGLPSEVEGSPLWSG